MDWIILLRLFESCHYFYYQPGEKLSEFFLRVLRKALLALLLVFAIICYFFDSSGESGFGFFRWPSRLILGVLCLYKASEVLMATLMAFKVKCYAPITNVRQHSYTGIISELSVDALSLREKELIYLKVLTNPFLGPRDKSVVSLRNWLAFEIFKPLAGIMSQTEMAFLATGLQFKELGDWSLYQLETLKTINSFVGMYAPKFPLLVNFLRCTQDQRYLVHRLRSLAQGSYLVNFKPPPLNSSKQEYTSEISDSAIVFHCFCVFMDAYFRHYRIYASRPRPFFEDYVVTSFAVPRLFELKNGIAIHYLNRPCPNFNILLNRQNQMIIEENTDVLEVLVDFFHIIQNEKNGYLGCVDLSEMCSSILCQFRRVSTPPKKPIPAALQSY